VPESNQYLLVGSTEAYSGKSAMILGIANQLRTCGLEIAYGKPIGTCFAEAADSKGALVDEDVLFVAETLELSPDRLRPTLLPLDTAALERRIGGEDTTLYSEKLAQSFQAQGEDLVLLEGPGTLDEGRLFELSLPQMAETMNAPVLLVARFILASTVDTLMAARERLGDRLLGVLLNDVPRDQLEFVQSSVCPFLEARGIPVFGTFPRSSLLRSVSVAELVKKLDAEVLCRGDRLDLMVESLTIGAMNVNSALKYFRKGRNMAVVTGGDRTDIQLAALETSTQCLILTGHLPPVPMILSRAEDLEIPILSVDLDTLTTVEIIDQAFGQVRLQEPAKVEHVFRMMGEHLDCDRLLQNLGLRTKVAL